MKQRFGVLIFEKILGAVDKRDDPLIQPMVDFGWTVESLNDTCSLENYLVENKLKNDELGAAEINNRVVIFGFEPHISINDEPFGAIASNHRSLHQFACFWKGEYAYKYYSDGKLAAHRVCVSTGRATLHEAYFQKGDYRVHGSSPLLAGTIESLAEDLGADINDVKYLGQATLKRGRSSLAFHPDKNIWVYGSVLLPDKTEDGKYFQEISSSGSKRGKPFKPAVEPKTNLEIFKWDQLHYESDQRMIEQLLGFRFDKPSSYPDKIKLKKYRITRRNQ